MLGTTAIASTDILNHIGLPVVGMYKYLTHSIMRKEEEYKYILIRVIFSPSSVP